MITLLLYSYKINSSDTSQRIYYCDDFCKGTIFWTGTYTSTKTSSCHAPSNSQTWLSDSFIEAYYEKCGINLTIPTAIPPQTAYPAEPAQTAYPAQTLWAAPTAWPGQTLPLMPTGIVIQIESKLHYWYLGGLFLMFVIEGILIGYAICLFKKTKVKAETPPEIPIDETIPIPRNMPDFTVTLNNEEPSLELSDEYFLAMEEEEVSQGNYLVH